MYHLKAAGKNEKKLQTTWYSVHVTILYLLHFLANFPDNIHTESFCLSYVAAHGGEVWTSFLYRKK